MHNIDFGRHSEDYAAFRPGFPAAFYEHVDRITPIRGSQSLDLATGPGTIALELGARGSNVLGIDISESLIATAKRVSHARRLKDRVQFMVARAENTGLQADSFDLATAGQCWHWFDSDAVALELQRVLRPGANLIVAYFSYLTGESPVAADTEDLILEFNPAWSMAGSTGIFPERIDQITRGGFELIDEFCFDHDELFSHVGWRGRMRTCNGVGSGGLSAFDVERFDHALADLLRAHYPDPVVVKHRVWSIIGRKPLKQS